MATAIERPLREFRSTVTGFMDVFICCASFEARCLSIAEQIDPACVGAVLLAHNDGMLSGNGVKICERFGDKVKLVAFRIDEPIQTADVLRQALECAISSPEATVVADITTFTHEQLLILLGLLRAGRRGKRLILAYSGAAEYMVGTEKWLSHGIREIRSVLGYPGVLLPSRNVHLVVLVGFELERAERLVEEYEPATISLGYARPADSILASMSETNQKFHSQLAGRLENVHHFTFSCRDAVATRDAIVAQVAKFPGYSAVVAPMNTKVSTVGAALASSQDPSIQLCYAEAKRYNLEGYSRPGDSFYLVDAPGLWDQMADRSSGE